MTRTVHVHCVESGTKVQRKLMTWLLVESSGCYKSSTNQTTLVVQIIRYCLQGTISLLILPLLDCQHFAVNFLFWPLTCKSRLDSYTFMLGEMEFFNFLWLVCDIYSRVHISWNEVFFKILKKPSIFQK